MVATILCVDTAGMCLAHLPFFSPDVVITDVTSMEAMYHSGIGGGGFMLVRAPYSTFTSINIREIGLVAAFEDMHTNNTAASMFGGLAM